MCSTSLIPILSNVFKEWRLLRWDINYYRAGLRTDEISLTKDTLKLSAEIYMALKDLRPH